MQIDNGKQLTFTMPVLILYLRSRDKFDAMRLFKIRELGVQARQQGFEQFFLDPGAEFTDRYMNEHKTTAPELLERFFAKQGRKFSQYRMFWFAGYGSSLFCRQMCTYVFENQLEFEDHMDNGSPLKAQLRWYELYREMEEGNNSNILRIESS